MNMMTQPIIWAPVLGFFIAALAFMGTYQSQGLTRKILMLLALIFVLAPAYLLAAVFAPNVFDSRIRTYWAFYDAIENGMTRQQVLSTVDHYYPEGGNRQRPKVAKDTDERIVFFMNPEEYRQPNCEGIFLDMSEGRVSRKQYAAD